jgi:hypothetical protein
LNNLKASNHFYVNAPVAGQSRRYSPMNSIKNGRVKNAVSQLILSNANSMQGLKKAPLINGKGIGFGKSKIAGGYD